MVRCEIAFVQSMEERFIFFVNSQRVNLLKLPNIRLFTLESKNILYLPVLMHIWLYLVACKISNDWELEIYTTNQNCTNFQKIKGKVEQPNEWSSALLYTSVW